VSAKPSQSANCSRISSNLSKTFGPPRDGSTWRAPERRSEPLAWSSGSVRRLPNYWPCSENPPEKRARISPFLNFLGDGEFKELVSDEDSTALQNWVIQTLAKEMRSVKNPSIATRRDLGLIAALCAAPAKGTPRKWPENCLKIDGREVLLWDTAIEEPCFALPLRFWHAWRERLARPEQRRLYRKSLQWSQSGLLFPGPSGAPLSRAAHPNALRRLNFARPPNSIGPITPEKIRAAFL
jgi:hypothetical protein